MNTYMRMCSRQTITLARIQVGLRLTTGQVRRQLMQQVKAETFAESVVEKATLAGLEIIGYV